MRTGSSGCRWPVHAPAVLKRLQTAGSPEAYRRGAKYEGQKEDFGESPLMNSYQFDGVFEDGALWKHGNLGQGIYIDPARDFVGVYVSTNGLHTAVRRRQDAGLPAQGGQIRGRRVIKLRRASAINTTETTYKRRHPSNP